MNSVVSDSDLIHGLRRLGIQPGMTLEVHCSLSSFGHLEGGANTVIDTLMRETGAQGAIVMPSFRLSPNLPLTDEDHRLGLSTKIRILPENVEHTAMGIVADTFRQRPDVLTGSGIFRVSAWGKDADKHATGLQHLINNGGYALLLGVDIYSLSAMHYVEDVLPEEIRNRFKPSDTARTKYPEDQWLIEAWTPKVKPWYAIQDAAYSKGLIVDTNIGRSQCRLFHVLPVIELYRQALQERPFELYGLQKGNYT